MNEMNIHEHGTKTKAQARWQTPGCCGRKENASSGAGMPKEARPSGWQRSDGIALGVLEHTKSKTVRKRARCPGTAFRCNNKHRVISNLFAT